jgi:hypothetical protein
MEKEIQNVVTEDHTTITTSLSTALFLLCLGLQIILALFKVFMESKRFDLAIL